MSDPAIVEHCAWKYADDDRSSICMLIRALSQKPYAQEVAAFWQMQWFNIAGPMEWNGRKFIGNATGFITISETSDNLIKVSFTDEEESLVPQTASVADAERLVDALVIRLLSKKVEEVGAGEPATPSQPK